MVTSREIVDIVEIIFYVPALLAAAWCARKHGLGRQQGWIFLIILSLLRLISAATGIAYVYNPSNTNLIACSIVCSGIGLSPLLLALGGIDQRLNEGMKGRGLRSQVIRLISIPIMVALILAIIAGTKLYSDNLSTRSDGEKFQEAAMVLFLIGFIMLAGVTLLTATKKQYILKGEHRLLLAALLSLPFILVRIIWSLITAFDHNSNVFSLISDSHTAVVVWAIMALLMEFIVVTIYLLAGSFVRSIPRHMVKEGYANPPAYGRGAGNQEQYAMKPETQA